MHFNTIQGQINGMLHSHQNFKKQQEGLCDCDE